MNCVRKVPFIGRVARRYLSLVTAADITSPAFDDTNLQVTRECSPPTSLGIVTECYTGAVEEMDCHLRYNKSYP